MTRNEALKIAKPILFNTEMVRAIQGGFKTVTRRVIKPRSKKAYGFFVITRVPDGAFAGVYDYDEEENAFDYPQKEPYKVGDILYVRETWGRYSVCEGIMPSIFYKADDNAPSKIKWIPSIHMPKEAARIFLRVTAVRVEQLQDITVSQSTKEGCVSPCSTCRNEHNSKCVGSGILLRECPIDRLYSPFVGIWNSSIKESELELYGWDANPWVRVIEFERIEMDGKEKQYGTNTG